VLLRKDDATLTRVKADVRELADAFPLYAERNVGAAAANAGRVVV
jgi:hypothetical protein